MLEFFIQYNEWKSWLAYLIEKGNNMLHISPYLLPSPTIWIVMKLHILRKWVCLAPKLLKKSQMYQTFARVLHMKY